MLVYIRLYYIIIKCPVFLCYVIMSLFPMLRKKWKHLLWRSQFCHALEGRSSSSRARCCSVGRQVGTCRRTSVPAGPSHMSLYVRPRAGSALSRWSLGDGAPVASLGGDYFVFYSRGLRAAPWRFWLQLTVSADPGNLPLPRHSLLPTRLHSCVKNLIATS